METQPASQQPQAEEALRLGPDQATQRLVLLHGWGADADDLLDLGELLVGPNVSVVALRAPEPHPYGSGRQWYNLQPIDWSALPAARRALRGRLEQLGASVPLERTVLLGFSQGGAMAIDVGGGLPLAGIVACSGYPHRDWQPQATATPVLLTHGREDPVVPSFHGDRIQSSLEQAGIQVQRQDFRGGHGIDPALFPLMRQLLQRSWPGSSPL